MVIRAHQTRPHLRVLPPAPIGTHTPRACVQLVVVDRGGAHRVSYANDALSSEL